MAVHSSFSCGCSVITGFPSSSRSKQDERNMSTKLQGLIQASTNRRAQAGCNCVSDTTPGGSGLGNHLSKLGPPDQLELHQHTFCTLLATTKRVRAHAVRSATQASPQTDPRHTAPAWLSIPAALTEQPIVLSNLSSMIPIMFGAAFSLPLFGKDHLTRAATSMAVSLCEPYRHSKRYHQMVRSRST